MSFRGDFVPFRIMGMRINTGMSLRGVENPVAISFGNRNSHNALTFGVNVFPFHVIPSDPQVAWESSGFRQSRPNGVRERCPHKNSYETKVKSLILRSEMKEFELPIIQDSLLVPVRLTANLFGLVFSVPFLLAQKKRHQRKHVRVFCPKIHKHGLFYKPSVCVRSTDTTRRTEVLAC